MDRMTTYEIRANLELLKSAHDKGALLEQLDAPLRSMVSDIVNRAAKRPLSIYLCSSDHDMDVRNHLGHVLSLWIQKREPTALLVDCDFLATGLSGVVPHRDALGFLDLLLYGTSLGVITQEATAGVSVVGAGSFPVTKKSPFALDTFDNTLRYLNTHSKCVVFCGPVWDDDESVHPITGHVDLTILVNAGTRFREGALDPLENSVAGAAGTDAWSVRINTRLREPSAEVSTPVQETPQVEEETATLVAEVEGLVDDAPRVPAGAEARVRDEKRERAPVIEEPTRVEAEGAAVRDGARSTVEFVAEASGGEPGDDIAAPALDKKTRGSRWLRIVTPVVGIFLIAFVVWWLYLTKSVREREQRLADMPTRPVVTEPATPSADTTAAVSSDSTATPDAGIGVPIASGPVQQATPETVPPERDPNVEYANGVPLAERLDEYANKYLVHVSSFRRIDHAKDEALYLMGWGYPVFLYRIDLGGKGIWYRVYVGPSDTREEAEAFKIKLDGNPRIQSTRIARVPG